MPFPDAEYSIITEDKARGYLLNLFHPSGRSKAVWLKSIGYSLENWQELVEDLNHLARTSNSFLAKPSPFGVKYEVRGLIGRPGYRPAKIVTVWIVEHENQPRLVTAFPE